MSGKPMKGLALLIAAKPKGKGAPSDDDDAPESYGEGEEGGSEDEYGSELADIIGVSEDDKPDFMRALHGYVRACVAKEEE